MAFEDQGKNLVSLNPLEVISCPLVQVFDGQACSPQTSQTLISLKAAVLVGVGDLQPEMSPSSLTEFISAGSSGPVKQGRGHLNGRAVWAAGARRQLWLGGSFQRSLIGVINSAESLTYSARCWALLIPSVCKRLHIWCGNHMVKQAVHVSANRNRSTT